MQQHRRKRGGALGGFVFGVALGGIAAFFVARHLLIDRSRADLSLAVEADDPADSAAPTTPAAGAESTEERIARKLREWHLTPEDIKRELGRAGDVIRREGGVLGRKISEAGSDVRIIAVIKARLTLDKELSGWAIAVGSKDGHVTLSGTVDRPELIGRAIVIALETDGVIDVASSLQARTGALPPEAI